MANLNHLLLGFCGGLVVVRVGEALTARNDDDGHCLGLLGGLSEKCVPCHGKKVVAAAVQIFSPPEHELT